MFKYSRAIFATVVLNLVLVILLGLLDLLPKGIRISVLASNPASASEPTVKQSDTYWV